MLPMNVRAILVVACLYTSLIFLTPEHYRLNLTSSLPLGIYDVTDEAEVKGLVVAICLPEPLASESLKLGYTEPGSCPSKTKPLLKIVAASSGDHVSTSPTGIAVNGTPLASSAPLKVDRRGRPLPPPWPSTTLPPRTIWLYAPHPQSWDSRYFGPLPLSSIDVRMRPLLTFR